MKNNYSKCSKTYLLVLLCYAYFIIFRVDRRHGFGNFEEASHKWICKWANVKRWQKNWRERRRKNQHHRIGRHAKSRAVRRCNFERQNVRQSFPCARFIKISWRFCSKISVAIHPETLWNVFLFEWRIAKSGAKKNPSSFVHILWKSMLFLFRKLKYSKQTIKQFMSTGTEWTKSIRRQSQKLASNTENSE